MKAASISLACLCILWACSLGGPAQNAPGILNISIIDAATKQRIPARVEVLDRDGKGYIAETALLIGGDCTDREVPSQNTLEQCLGELTPKFTSLHTGTDQFFADGACRLPVPPGDYRIRVFRGLEYRVNSRELPVRPGQTHDVVVALKRWSNLAEKGWHSADSHLHIGREFKELNPRICKFMQAEDINVGNLIQWGNARHFHNARQYAFGPEGQYHEGDYWLASGQENPRTHFLGHTLTLGGGNPINVPDAYLVYKNFWEESRRQNALSGYCHFALRRGAEDGIILDLFDNLLTFIEIIQNERGIYQIWYDALNLGFRLVPIAGTDYPCGLTAQVTPGRERFYTRVEGPLTYDSWLEGIRRGRTFVTNGPLLEFTVSGKRIGDEIELSETGPVVIEASVRFDAERDNVEALEIVENGEVVRRFPRVGSAEEIRCRFERDIDESSWLAVRASGRKRGELPSQRLADTQVAPSLAHSAPIYVTLKNAPVLGTHRRVKFIAAAWLERLAGLEYRLADNRLRDLANYSASDGVSADDLRKNKDALLRRIAIAKQQLNDRAR
ncbi:MAG: CehA/McbA family metallohydrolase [Planctomycetia bacterium]|nr:CehA/McbA family metallohydrolase [Planctomycetia bacterium]